jgi:L-2-hydroxyglutarate oxidase
VDGWVDRFAPEPLRAGLYDQPVRSFDVAVVGAGLVGLATARKILEARPGLRLVVIDKEPGVGRHQSGHNSGVIHSGVYYQPGSLKARLCRQGQAEMEFFATSHGINWQRCGKLIVAVEPGEVERLHRLAERAAANGVSDARLIGPAEMADIEPYCAGIEALHVPGTGIIDFSLVARAMSVDLLTAGAELYLGREVRSVAELSDRVVVVTEAGDIEAGTVVTCAGLYSDHFGRRTEAGAPDERIVPFRGDYCLLSARAAPMCKGLIYPVPDPALPFLGVHLTRRIDGEVWVGPNAVLALAREGYTRTTVNFAELADLLSYQGFHRLVRRWWRTGAGEMWRDLSKRSFLAAVRRYVPAIALADLHWGPAGVRAQSVRGDGSMVDDFSIIRGPRALHVRNAPSPAATASLAIGGHLAALALEAQPA